MRFFTLCNIIFSLSTLVYCMKEPDWMRHVLDPSIIIQALLLGPLSGGIVEPFLLHRDEQFRVNAKRLLLEAESWTKDSALFEQAVIGRAFTTLDKVPSFEQFCNNVKDLMRELRRGMFFC